MAAIHGLTRGATTNMLSTRMARTVAVIATKAYLFSSSEEEYRYDHPRDRSREEHDQPEVDDRVWLGRGDALNQGREPDRETCSARRTAAPRSPVGEYPVWPSRNRRTEPSGDQGKRGDDAVAQHEAYRRFEAVSPGHLPYTPWMSISTARITMTGMNSLPYRGVLRPDQDPRARHRPQQDAHHHGRGDEGVDVSAQIEDPGAGRGGDPDHEVARGRGDLHRELHPHVEREHLQRPAPDAKEARDQAGRVHDGEPQGRTRRLIVDPRLQRLVVVFPAQLQPLADRVGGDA